MKTYQETVELFVPAYQRSLDGADFYDHREWAEFVATEQVKIETAAFIFGTTREAMCADIIAAANAR